MRYENWETRLQAIVTMYERRRFEWGKFDCVLFCADVVWALTQKNPGDGWRGNYSDEAGAKAIIAAQGGLQQMVDTALAGIGLVCDRINPNFAQRGDVCLMRGDGPALGVCVGADVVGFAPVGIARRPISDAAVVWAIR